MDSKGFNKKDGFNYGARNWTQRRGLKVLLHDVPDIKYYMRFMSFYDEKEIFIYKKEVLSSPEHMTEWQAKKAAIDQINANSVSRKSAPVHVPIISMDGVRAYFLARTYKDIETELVPLTELAGTSLQELLTNIKNAPFHK